MRDGVALFAFWSKLSYYPCEIRPSVSFVQMEADSLKSAKKTNFYN